MRVRVHYNLTRHVWSIFTHRHGGKRGALGWYLLEHRDSVALTDVVPVVSIKTIERIRRAYATTGKPQREICARLEGTLADHRAETAGMRKVVFNPYTLDSFVWADTGAEYTGSSTVILPNGKTYALAN